MHKCGRVEFINIFVEFQQLLVSVYDVTPRHLLQLAQADGTQEVGLFQHLSQGRTLIHETLKVDAVTQVEDVTCLVGYNLYKKPTMQCEKLRARTCTSTSSVLFYINITLCISQP